MGSAAAGLASIASIAIEYRNIFVIAFAFLFQPRLERLDLFLERPDGPLGTLQVDLGYVDGHLAAVALGAAGVGHHPSAHVTHPLRGMASPHSGHVLGFGAFSTLSALSASKTRSDR